MAFVHNEKQRPIRENYRKFGFARSEKYVSKLTT